MALIRGSVIKLTGTVIDELIETGYQDAAVMTPPSVKVPEYIVLWVNPDADTFGMAINREVFKPEMLELSSREIYLLNYAFSVEEKEVVK